MLLTAQLLATSDVNRAVENLQAKIKSCKEQGQKNKLFLGSLIFLELCPVGDDGVAWKRKFASDYTNC